MNEKQKILVCGDVEGKFNTLFDRIKIINRKSGPFDLLLCVGNFFGINNREFDAYRSGTKKVPIPTYILGPNQVDHVDLYPDNDSMELCQNLYYLGKKGLYTDSKGLKIAYISGISNLETSSYEYSGNDITEVYNSCLRGNPSFRGIDILLTSQWPSNINDGSKQVNLSVNKASDFPAWLLMKLKPRYHISGLEGFHYECPPFRAPNLGDHDTTINLVTRFLGLARVGNTDKEKWLYAVSLTPLDKMKISELLQKTTDEIVCPLNFEEINQKVFNVKRKIVKPNQYFYDSNAPDETLVQPVKKKRQKLEFDQSKCWFCLASPSIEKHLIITVADTTYLALAKGPMVNEHFLICPIEHYQSSLNQPEEVQKEVNEFKKAISKFYGRNNEVAVFFERNYKTSHMQLQAVPIPRRAVKNLTDIFMNEGLAHGLKLEVLEGRLNQVVPEKVPYFTVEFPDVTLYTRIKGNFPLNFGRKVLSIESILNCINKSDWRECILTKEEEEQLVRKLRTDFEPFEFTND